MKRKSWASMDKFELKRTWTRFKVARNNDIFTEHAIALKNPDWISCVQREALIDALIERLR